MPTAAAGDRVGLRHAQGQLDRELHRGRSLTGVTTRVARRLPALTAAIRHDRATGRPITRSLIAHDH
jgi:hypothetical protein